MKPPMKTSQTVTAEAVRRLQQRVTAFAATGTTNNSPTTYHR
ncbi:hypothetical protein [Streptomyces sp. NBC_01233]|nr:hypothetical protein OG332_16590 [Streptomyces sp. NBC_01233]